MFFAGIYALRVSSGWPLVGRVWAQDLLNEGNWTVCMLNILKYFNVFKRWKGK
jgi:hypothetical protein